jgi:NAD(P)-dependent dehydrogenase (short-subunit alcohol dehydrogenase family)
VKETTHEHPPHYPSLPARPRGVLVTGATGLLGSNVTAELLAAGAEALAPARSAERARRLLPAHVRLRILEGDITRTEGFATGCGESTRSSIPPPTMIRR